MWGKNMLTAMIILLLVTTTSIYAVYSSRGWRTGSEDYITVRDLAGREVKVPRDVNRVVAIGPGCLRLIVYLNATDMIVGVEDIEHKWIPYGRPYRLAHPELAQLPVIGNGGPNYSPNAEAIIEAGADVIFATFMDASTADNLQEKTGIPVVVLSYGKHATFITEELFESLRLAGRILHREERAEQVISFIEGALKDLDNRTRSVSDSVKPRVYVGGLGYKGIHGIDSTERCFPPFTAVHAINVADELGGCGHIFVDKEQILSWNPDIIFIDEAGLALVKQDYEKNPDYYISLKAFREGELYGIMPFNYYATNIGTALADAYYIGKVLYPDRFSDIDPAEKADEIYSFLVGKPVYNEMAEYWGGFKCLAEEFTG